MQICDILLTYDDPQFLDIISWSLKDRGHDVTIASNVAEAKAKLNMRHFDVVLTQLVSNPEDSISVLKEAKRIDPETIVILLGGQEIAKIDCNELPQEADEYVFTPCGIPKLWKRVQSCIEKLELKRKDVHCKASRKQLAEMAEDLKDTVAGKYGNMDAEVGAVLSRHLKTVQQLVDQSNAALDEQPARH